jgi:hypothetical protein
VLSAFLQRRGGRLHEMSVEQIRGAASMRSLSRAMASTGQKIAGMGENEMAEGVVRLAVSQGMAEKSDALTKESELHAVRGMNKVAVAAEADQVARSVARDAAGEIAAGSAELGSAAATAGFAEALEEKAKK